MSPGYDFLYRTSLAWKLVEAVVFAFEPQINSPILGEFDLLKHSQNGRMATAPGKFWMKINHWGRAKRFITEYAEAEQPLRTWKKAVVEASWKSYPDVKQTFNSADWYQGAIIFDIGGNNFRLIAICRFELGRLYIDKVLTHEEYSRGAWKKRYPGKQ